MRSDYLATFANVFDRKYFDDNIEEFFVNINSDKDYLNEYVKYHSNTFIEIPHHLYNIFLFDVLLKRLPNTVIVQKITKGKKMQYIKIKRTDV